MNHGPWTILYDRPGDFNRDFRLDTQDVDQLCEAIRSGDNQPQYDLDGNSILDLDDLDNYLDQIIGTSNGDVQLDGAFDAEDLFLIMFHNKVVYEKGKNDRLKWSTGDLNCDGEFNSSDLIRVFQSTGSQPSSIRLPVRKNVAAAIQFETDDKNETAETGQLATDDSLRTVAQQDTLRKRQAAYLPI